MKATRIIRWVVKPNSLGQLSSDIAISIIWNDIYSYLCALLLIAVGAEVHPSSCCRYVSYRLKVVSQPLAGTLTVNDAFCVKNVPQLGDMDF